MQGLHLTADLRDCALPLPDLAALRERLLRAVRAAGLTPVAELFHPFDPQGAAGITGVVLLAESHLAVHTWPELRAVTLDVYVCNFGADNTARAESLMAALIEGFCAGSAQVQRIERGA